MKKNTSKKPSDGRREAAQQRRQEELRVQQNRNRVSVGLLRYNHVIAKVTNQLNDALKAVSELSPEFNGQRELQMRSQMALRVMNSALRMLVQNKLQLWMIDDDSLRNE